MHKFMLIPLKIGWKFCTFWECCWFCQEGPTFCLFTHPNSKHVANSNHHSSWQSFGHWFHLTNCVCQCVGGFGGTQWTSCSSSHFVKTGKMVSRATFLRSLVQGCRALLGHNTNRGHSVKCIDFEAILEFFLQKYCISFLYSRTRRGVRLFLFRLAPGAYLWIITTQHYSQA